MRPFVSMPRVLTITQTFGSVIVVTAICLLIGCWVVQAHADQEYMTITFDDKTIDAPIGTGGPAVGEPSWVEADLQAIVRAAPFPTPSLEICDLSAQGALGFEMPTPVSEGVVAVVTDVWPYADVACDYAMSLRTHFNQVVLTIFLDGNGALRVWDLNGDATSGLTHATGRSVPILVAIDMDARTYSVWIDEIEIVTNRAVFYQIDDFNLVHFSGSWNCPEGNKFSIDKLRVLDHIPEVPVAPTSWGRLRVMYR